MWLPALEPFTEAEVDGGKTLQSKDDVILPEKWEWSGDWSVDSSIICDEEGEEYIFAWYVKRGAIGSERPLAPYSSQARDLSRVSNVYRVIIIFLML